MRRPIKPAWLLRLARELAGEGAAQGQPRNTNLRRAASTAYYALFHAISLGVAAEALPNAALGEQYAYARYITHTSVRKCCAWIAGEGPPKHLDATVKRLRMNTALSDVAAAFIALYEAREAADYDHDADITRPATLTVVQRAVAAVGAIDTNAATDDFRAFFGLVTLQTSIRN